MSDGAKRKIEKTLNKLPFVRWDRMCDADGILTIFGWIDREKDPYKDFVSIDFFADGDWDTFMTSSSKYSLTIFKLLRNSDGRGHRNCKRVEHIFDVHNPIVLKTA